MSHQTRVNIPPVADADVSDRSVALRFRTPALVDVVIGSGPQGTVVKLIREGRTEVPWQGSANDQPADLVPLGDRRAMALLPGQALLTIDPFSRHLASRCRNVGQGRVLPQRLYSVAGRLTALHAKPDGRTVLSEMRQNGAILRGSARPGPTLLDGQVPGLLFSDGEGRLHMSADDTKRGFHLWRQAPDGTWELLNSDGALRYASNAAISAAATWDGVVALAVGPTPELRARLFGMPIPGEVLLLGSDGSIQILCGELRGGLSGLLVPRLSASRIAALRLGSVSRLATDDDLLLIAVEKDNEGTGVFAVTPDLEVEALGNWPRSLALLDAGEEGLAVVTMP